MSGEGNDTRGSDHRTGTGSYRYMRCGVWASCYVRYFGCANFNTHRRARFLRRWTVSCLHRAVIVRNAGVRNNHFPNQTLLIQSYVVCVRYSVPVARLGCKTSSRSDAQPTSRRISQSLTMICNVCMRACSFWMGRSCQSPDCSKGASFGLPGKLAVTCGTHKEPGMVNVRCKRCDHPDGCGKVPAFGLPGASRSRCTTHKEPGMVNLLHKRCPHPGGCTKIPSFGPPGGTATHCAAHMEPGMVNVRSKPCHHPGGCSTLPCYGLPGCTATHCAAHREPGMINVTGKRCDDAGGCRKEAAFGLPGGSRTRCATHKEPGMVCLAMPQHARSSQSGGPGASPVPEHGHAGRGTVPSGTGGGSSWGGGTGRGNSGSGRRGNAGGGRSAAAAATSGPAPRSGGRRMPAAASPGLIAAANPASSSSAARVARGIRKRSRLGAPASEPNRQQQAAGGEGSSRKRPRGMAQAVLPQAARAGPSAGPHPSPPKRSRQDASVPASEPNRRQAGGDGSSRERPRGVAQVLPPQVASAGPSARAPPSSLPAAATMVVPPRRRSLRAGAPDVIAASATVSSPPFAGATTPYLDVASAATIPAVAPHQQQDRPHPAPARARNDHQHQHPDLAAIADVKSEPQGADVKSEPQGADVKSQPRGADEVPPKGQDAGLIKLEEVGEASSAEATLPAAEASTANDVKMGGKIKTEAKESGDVTSLLLRSVGGNCVIML